MPKWAIILLIAAPALIISVAAYVILRTSGDKPPVSAVAANATAKTEPAQPPSIPLPSGNLVSPPPQSVKISKPERASSAPAIQIVASATGSISGAAWLNRNDGESLLQRGLRIQLLKKQVASEPVLAMCRIAADAQLKSILDLRQKIAKDSEFVDKTRSDIESLKQDIIGNLDQIKQLYALRDEVQAGIESDRRALQERVDKLTRLGSFLEAKPVPAFVNLTDTYDLMKAAAIGRDVSFDPIASACEVASVETDVDGKYAITMIPVGDYFLRAKSSTSDYFIEWLIPVHVDQPPKQINLDNANSLYLSSQHE